MEVDATRSVGLPLATSWQPEVDKLPEPIHFIGIGGIGMSALARLLLVRGVRVSGSDKSGSPVTEELARLGAQIFVGHDRGNVEQSGCVIVSTAITDSNPELARAKERQLPILHRSQMLSYLCRQHKVVAVSGTHGKTTTTGMVSQVLLDAGLDPTVVVGGIFDKVGSNSHAGKGQHFVLEADESDRTHSQVKSEIAVVTNIECDHLENYPGGLEQILDVMASFANHGKQVVLCLDDPGCRQLLDRLDRQPVTYGSLETSPDADWTLVEDNGSFTVSRKGQELAKVTLNVPGRHNKMNALASIVVASLCGVATDVAARALESFAGVDRRFQIIGEANGVLVVDDYGHHPTEVRATLEAAQQYRLRRGGEGRVVALFQPHQPGRLRDLWDEFVQSFTQADLVLLADVYIARGGQIEGINSESFAKAVNHKNVRYMAGPTSELPAKVVEHLKPGDIVLTIGAGDITNVGKPLLEQLQKRP